MATTTPNYGWVVPTSTDLVKDGATAIETLGDSADATLKALNPETTLGDISYRSATANTNTRLAIGSTGQVLTVAGGVPTWAAGGATSGPAFRAYLSSNQTGIASETWTKVTLNAETFDTANNFDSTTNYRWTPTTAGYYSINAQALIGRSSSNGFGYLKIYKNGSSTGAPEALSAMGAEAACQVALADVVYMNGTTDYMECFVWISGAEAFNSGGTGGTYFGGVWIRS